MSNSLMDTVAQAVNTLVSALKLPDEAAKANHVMGSMNYPQFSRVLPYKDYDSGTGLFFNTKTVGFIFEARPLPGANTHIVSSLENLLRTKLPRNVPVTVNLVSSKLVGDDIEYGLREFSWSGKEAEKFNAITRAYYLRAAETQFSLPPGMDLPLTLRNYRVFISCCVPRKKNSKAQIIELENHVKIIRASLQGAQIPTRVMNAQELVDMVREMVNPDPEEMYSRPYKLDQYQDLNYQCVDDSFDMQVTANHLKIGLLDRKGKEKVTRVTNFHLERDPEIAFLWTSADNYANLLNPELSISCPFVITLSYDYFTSRKTTTSGNITDNNASSRVDQIAASLSSAKNSYDQYTSSRTRSQEYSEMASRTESLTGQMSENLTQQFASFVQQRTPRNASEILTNTTSPEIAAQREALAREFVKEQVKPRIDGAYEQGRESIGQKMAEVGGGGDRGTVMADYSHNTGGIETMTREAKIKDNVSHTVEGMIEQNRQVHQETSQAIDHQGGEVKKQQADLESHHKTEGNKFTAEYNENIDKQVENPFRSTTDEFRKQAEEQRIKFDK